MRYWTSEVLNGANPVEIGKMGKVFNRGTSDGSAMRIAGSGLVNPGDLEGAIKTAITMTKISHGTQHAYSGSCAIACAVAEALTENSSVDSIVEAAIYGAKNGEIIGNKEARQASGARVLPVMLRAIDIARNANSIDEASILIEENCGASCDIQTAVAIVMGLFVACDGDIMDTLIACANYGCDTDTYACIAGMIVGAYKGYGNIPYNFVEKFDKANPGLDFDWASDELIRIINER